MKLHLTMVTHYINLFDETIFKSKMFHIICSGFGNMYYLLSDANYQKKIVIFH